MCFYLWKCLFQQCYTGSLDTGEILAKGIRDGCEASVKIGLAVINPAAAKAADYAYIAVDYAVDRVLVGRDQAQARMP